MRQFIEIPKKKSINKNILRSIQTNKKGKIMKNKLMLTSALVGSLVAGSSAIAQTTITGSLDLSYTGLESKLDGSLRNSVGGSSFGGMGREAQLNIQNKGKTNIAGLDYAAGFALEFDGNSLGTGTEASTISNENTYIDFIMGGTTLTFGVDHIQNSHNNLSPTASINMAEIADAQLSVSYTNAVGANPKESIGVGIMQATPVGTFSALFVPTNNDTGSRDTRTLIDKSGRNSAYEVGFRGDLGVKGLDAKYFYNKEDASGQTGVTGGQGIQDLKGKSAGLAYNFGQVTVGADKQWNKNVVAPGTSGITAATATQLGEKKTTQYGVAYAASKDLSVSVNKAKTDRTDIVSTGDEEWMQYAVGYNFGPIASSISYVTVDNVGNLVAQGDYKIAYVRLSTKF
jgi:hypothetical protein